MPLSTWAPLDVHRLHDSGPPIHQPGGDSTSTSQRARRFGAMLASVVRSLRPAAGARLNLYVQCPTNELGMPELWALPRQVVLASMYIAYHGGWIRPHELMVRSRGARRGRLTQTTLSPAIERAPDAAEGQTHGVVHTGGARGGGGQRRVELHLPGAAGRAQ